MISKQRGSIRFRIEKSVPQQIVDYSLEKLTQILSPSEFFRINRQYIVSLKCIQVVYTHFKGRLKLDILPAPKNEVFVSGDRMSDFKEWLGR